ncbi:hypothetical protein [Mastigocoleus sp. MO_188.B34]|uniref:hypothetical protein n=1 Tax=Mastigocoleus sp. MO_188.B34 TaxID=3036635 RepID=UPI00262F73ED|nr:hypothetical protein [Mastigocoleus sp. MO_188.B34]MDJ0694608.1 hypothetical protein [Mastigocoleus sp. MO_188.B34]
MITVQNRQAIGVFKKPEDVQLALQGLKDADFPINKVSVIGQDAKKEHHIPGVTNSNVIDELNEMLLDLGILVIPRVGPIMLTETVCSVMLAGAEATVIASTFAPYATKKRSLAGALITLGIPDDKAKIYSELFERGCYLLIVNGNEREIAIAEMIFRNRGIKKWDTYNVSAVTPSILNQRYQYAAGLFFLYRDLENALNELRQVGFPMEKITVVAKSTARLRNIYSVGITAPEYNFAALKIPSDIAKHYNYRVFLGDYLLLLSGTAIQLAAAGKILLQHQIQNYATFHPSHQHLATSTMAKVIEK